MTPRGILAAVTAVTLLSAASATALDAGKALTQYRRVRRRVMDQVMAGIC